MADIATLGIKVDSRGVVSATRDLQKLEGQGRKTEKVAGALKSAFVALGGAITIREIINYSDAYTSVQNQLRLTTDSHEELIAVQEKLLDIANRTASEIGATAELYATLTRNTEELSLSQGKILRVTELINKSFLITGKSAEEASGAIRQLSQGLAAGALRGDEFNSVAEGAPEIMRAIQKETGKTAGELREFAAEGKITAELLIQSLINYGSELDNAADKAELAFGSKLTIANNNITTFVGGLESSSGAVGSLGDAIVLLSENMETLAKIGETIAILYGARLIGSMAASGAALIANASKATTLQTAVVGLGSATGVYTRNATLAEKATKGLAVASTGLKGAIALLGGPAGVITLLAAELFLYHRSLKAAEKAAFDAAHPHLQLQVEARNTKEKIESLNKTIAAYAKQIKELERNGAPTDTVARLKSIMAGYQDEVSKLEKSLDSIQGKIRGTNLGEEFEKAKEKLDDLNSTLLQQVATFGMSETAVLKYRLQFGDLKDAMAALGDQGQQYQTSLLSLSSIYEKLKAQEESRKRIAEEQKRAEEELRSSYVNTIQSLEQQAALLKKTEREAFIYQAQLRLSANATRDMKDQVADLAGALYDEQKALEAANKIKEEGLSLTESMLTPQEQYIKQLEKIAELENKQAISHETANRAMVAARKARDEALKVTDEMTEFVKEAAKNMQDAMADGFFDFMQGEFGNLEQSFKRTIDRMVANLLASQLNNFLLGDFGSTGNVGGFIGDLVGGFFGGGSSVPVTELTAADASFDGGGFTGFGSRSGGLDGKGGFPALLHPNETVIDHTKGQQIGGNTININIPVQTVGDTTHGQKVGRSIAQQLTGVLSEANRQMGRST